MAYKILLTKVVGDTLSTTVMFDCCPEPIEIPHFMPPSSEAVIDGIENREASELAKIDAEAVNEQIKAELDGVVGVDSVDIKVRIEDCRARLSVEEVKPLRPIKG